MTENDGGKAGPQPLQLERAFRLLNKSLATFYDRKYELAVELCREALGHLLPEGSDPAASPEQRSDLFLQTYSTVLAVREAERIAGVFTFFENRRARFRFRSGAPLPNREWWQFIRIQREEAEGVIQATRGALNDVKESIAKGS